MTRNRTIVAQVVLIVALSITAFALAATRAQASEGAELVPHPILVAVPTCTKHAAWVAANR